MRADRAAYRDAGPRDHHRHGRVGRVVAAALEKAGQRFVVVEAEWRSWKDANADETAVIFGDATREDVLRAARPQMRC